VFDIQFLSFLKDGFFKVFWVEFVVIIVYLINMPQQHWR